MSGQLVTVRDFRRAGNQTVTDDLDRRIRISPNQSRCQLAIRHLSRSTTVPGVGLEGASMWLPGSTSLISMTVHARQRMDGLALHSSSLYGNGLRFCASSLNVHHAISSVWIGLKTWAASKSSTVGCTHVISTMEGLSCDAPCMP